MMLFT